MTHYQFLRDAQEAASISKSDDISIVMLPPSAGDQDIDSDEENDDDILEKNHMPEEVSGGVEIHKENEDSDNEEEQCTDQPCGDRK